MISSASLFHFTNNLDTFIDILREGFFRPNYSREDLGMFGLPNCLGIPMVSFCDIPLSRTEKHSEEYGCYALGLDKQWGMDQRISISPIHYIYPDSICAKVISDIYESLKNKSGLYECGCLDFNPQTAIFFYAKPYEGCSPKSKKSLVFYDEREWRYIPFAGPTLKEQKLPLDSEVQPMLSENDYLKPEIFTTKTEILHKIYQLKFEAKDIKHIIVKKEKDIPTIYDEVEKFFILPQCEEIERKKLMTRIISMEQIHEDF